MRAARRGPASMIRARPAGGWRTVLRVHRHLGPLARRVGGHDPEAGGRDRRLMRWTRSVHARPATNRGRIAHLPKLWITRLAGRRSPGSHRSCRWTSRHPDRSSGQPHLSMRIRRRGLCALRAAVRLRPVSKMQPIPLTIPFPSMTTAPSSAAALHISCGERSHNLRPTNRREERASTGEMDRPRKTG